MHQAFQEDFETWKQNLASPAPFGPVKALRERTKHRIACTVLRFASVLVREGFPIHKLAKLEDLTRLDNFRVGMAHYWRSANQQPTKTQHETARTILALARHWVRGAACFAPWSRLREKMLPDIARKGDLTKRRQRKRCWSCPKGAE